MTKQIDHKALAETLLDEASRTSVDPLFANWYLGRAQVHVELYAAEQQRTANLIAYLALPEVVQNTPSDAWKPIEEGLGL